MDEALLDILACPKCKGDLDYTDKPEAESLSCARCKLRYRVEDGIPVMLVDEAEKID